MVFKLLALIQPWNTRQTQASQGPRAFLRKRQGFRKIHRRVIYMNLYTTRTGRIISAVHTTTYYLQFISEVQPWKLRIINDSSVSSSRKYFGMVSFISLVLPFRERRVEARRNWLNKAVLLTEKGGIRWKIPVGRLYVSV